MVLWDLFGGCIGWISASVEIIGGYKNGICIVLLLVNLADLQDVLVLFLQVANGVIERQVRQSHFLFFRKFSFVF